MGIINCKKRNSGNAVMVGSGCIINANVVGYLPGSIYVINAERKLKKA